MQGVSTYFKGFQANQHVGSQLQFMWGLHLNFYKDANKNQLTFIVFMEQVYFWLSDMVKIEIGGSFQHDHKNYCVVDCIHNIIFIGLFFLVNGWTRAFSFILHVYA
jgi:hypothetical protein